MNDLGLLYICSFTGLLIIVGSFLLLWKGRILIDTAGKSVSEIQLPFGFRIRTQMPLVIMCFFGAFLLTLPVALIRNRIDGVKKVRLTGHVYPKELAKEPIRVYAAVADSYVRDEVNLVVPVVGDKLYRVVYVGKNDFFFDQYVDLSQAEDGPIKLQDCKLANPFGEMAGPQSGLATIKETDVVKEAPDLVANFK